MLRIYAIEKPVPLIRRKLGLDFAEHGFDSRYEGHRGMLVVSHFLLEPLLDVARLEFRRGWLPFRSPFDKALLA